MNLPKTDEVYAVIKLMEGYSKSEAEICVWFQVANSWLGSEKPIKYLEYSEGDYLVYAAQQYVLPVMHG